MRTIDLNCDMGESFGAWCMGADAQVMPWISSANIACGYHAGDPSTMLTTIRAAVAAGVAVGAHVGLPDLLGFGRRAMAIAPADLYAITAAQIGALAALARTVDTGLRHLKPHGALYHMLERDAALAQALVDAVRDVDPALRVVGLAGGRLLQTAAAAGLAVVHEAFVDRAYQGDGQLAARDQPGAVIDDVDIAVCQAIGLARDGEVVASDGARLRVRADTLCVHGDRPDAAVFARRLNERLGQAGVGVRAIGN